MPKPGPGGSGGVELTTVLRWASLLYALIVAVATLLPSDLAGIFGIGGRDGPAEDVLGEVLAYLAAAVALALVIVVPWRIRLAKRLGVSWPLFLCALGYVVGVALLASEDLRAVLYELAVYDLPDWPREMFGRIDPQHAAGYAGLSLLAGLAWRGRLHPVPVGGIVFVFSCLLEGLQEFVPGRQPSPVDLTSNAVGVLIGYVGIGLLAALSAERKPRHRPRSSHRSRHRTGRGRRHGRESNPPWRSGRHTRRG